MIMITIKLIDLIVIMIIMIIFNNNIYYNNNNNINISNYFIANIIII